MGSAVPLGQALTELAQAAPDAAAVTCGEQTVTRAELESAANRLARSYAALGVQAGDFVSVSLGNGIEFFAVVFALWKLGAVPQLLAPSLPRPERDAILRLAKPTLVIGETAAPQSVLPGFTPRPEIPDTPVNPPRVSPAWKAPTSGGSTGRPKLIVSGQPGEIDIGWYRATLGQRDGTRQLVCGPLYHNAPFNYAMYGLLAGQQLIVQPKFDAAAALAAIERFRISWVSLVPTMMSRLLRELDRHAYDISSLDSVWHGAAPCPAWLKRAWIDLVGPDSLHEVYGTTEGQMMTLISGTEWLARPGSVGRPMWGLVKILDADGRELPPGAEGEIYTRETDPTRPSYRYIGAEPKRRDGWDSVGDLGYLDADGYLYVSDRREDLILTGGANVYPAEVEAVLGEHPGVQSVAVVGLPDADLGQRVHAVVQTSAPVTDHELRAFAAQRLARYKVPRGFTVTSAALRDDAGKVRRRELAAQLAAAEHPSAG